MDPRSLSRPIDDDFDDARKQDAPDERAVPDIDTITNFDDARALAKAVADYAIQHRTGRHLRALLRISEALAHYANLND